MITLNVGNIETDITGDVNTPEFHSEFIALRKKMSFQPEGYRFTPAFRRHHWDGWIRLVKKNTKRCFFPTGLFSVARDHFKSRNVPFDVVDFRKSPVRNLETEYNTEKFKLRDYQQRVVDTSLDKGRGIIMAATGSGKTILGAGIIHGCGVKPFLFLVTSIDLLTQTKERLQEALYQNGSPLNVGQVGGGVIDIQDVTVMTVQTAVRALGKKFVQYDSDSKPDKTDKTLLQQHRAEIIETMETAQGVIADECQHWKADMCQIVTNSLKSAYYRYALSATPYRDSGDDILIQSCFGKKICEISASELIKKGFLVRPEISFVHINPSPSKFSNWQNIYKNRVVEDEYYNSLISNIAEEYMKAGRLVLVLVQQIEHGKTLESMIEGSLFVYGDSPKKERQTAIKKLRNRYINCIISTQIFDEGIDCKPLDTLILAGGGKSPTRAMQRIGRVLRPYKGKTTATVVDFFIHEKYLDAHAKAREKMYRTEKEFNIDHLFVD